jgi:hypothetical protein
MNWKHLVFGVCLVLIAGLIFIFSAIPFSEDVFMKKSISIDEIITRENTLFGTIGRIEVENTLSFPRDYTPPQFFGCLLADEAPDYQRDVQIFASLSEKPTYGYGIPERSIPIKGNEKKTLYLIGQYYGPVKPLVIEGGEPVKMQYLNISELKVYQLESSSKGLPPFSPEYAYYSCATLQEKNIEQTYTVLITP